jgi:hypothetical protein
MSEAASRWALVASIALHAAVLGVGLAPPRALRASSWASDFWAGKTFEVPEVASDLGEGDMPSTADETSSEITVDGIDLSPTTRAAPIPPAADDIAPASQPARPRAPGRTTLSSTAPAAAHGAGPGGSFGAEGSAPGVRDLLRSFVRAVPIVASSDPVWSSLPLGSAGATDVTLALDDEGKPHMARAEPAPAHLRRLIQKTVSVMSSGRFGISSSEGILSEQKLHIAVTLTQQPPPTEDQAVSGGLFALRFEPADDHNISHAFFTLASGRRVEVSVRPLTR